MGHCQRYTFEYDGIAVRSGTSLANDLAVSLLLGQERCIVFAKKAMQSKWRCPWKNARISKCWRNHYGF